MSATTLITRSHPAAALFGQKGGIITRFLGWIRKSQDAYCVAALDPRLAADAGLSATERFTIDRAAVLVTEACGDRRMARQILELDHPGMLADFQHAGRS